MIDKAELVGQRHVSDASAAEAHRREDSYKHSRQNSKHFHSVGPMTTQSHCPPGSHASLPSDVPTP